MKTSLTQNHTHESQYRIAELEERFQRQTLAMATSLVSLIDLRDRYTSGHSQRVAKYVRGIGMQMCLPDDQIETIVFAASQHDIGKIGVPDHILLKPGALSDEEFAWIRKHPEIGYRILKDIPQLTDILPGVLHHHERWDGGGYPQGLAGEGIPLVARLIALADSLDAMSSTRTYRSALSRGQVLDEIDRCVGTQFDPVLAKAFVELDFSQFDQLVRQHRETERALPGAREEAA